MLSFEEARARLLGLAKPVGAERVGLDGAAGRVLAADVVAAAPLPAFDTSAMDGYALATASLAGEGPFRLPIAGESRAGHAPAPLVSGAACRIFTGAVIPAGADAVVMQEDVRIAGNEAVFEHRPKPFAHVRRSGEDVPAGSTALRKGERLGAAHLALAAALGRSRLLVARRPEVTIVCVGDELREPGDGAGGAALYESNGMALAALARQAGANVRLSPILRDDAAEASRVLALEATRCDLLVTVGGVSVGDYDIVRPALENAGFSLDFWKVDIKPGKPVAVGTRGEAVVLALPGNPAAAYVTFVLFGMPLLRSLQGDLRALPIIWRMPLAAPYVRKGKRTEFVRARLELGAEGARVRLHPNQSSGALSSLAWSDSLARIPEGIERLEAGDPVDFLRLCDA